MATTLDEAQAMIDAAGRAGVVFNVGHSHSYDEPYRAMRELIASGELGRVRLLHNIYYSDWVYRPRRPEELDAKLGGGITFRQGAHQFDILRLLAGGLVKSVRAQTFDWDPQRPVIGAHSGAAHVCRRRGRDRDLQRLRGLHDLGDHLTVRAKSAIRKPSHQARRRAEMKAATPEAEAKLKRSRAATPAETELAPIRRSSAGRWPAAKAATSVSPRPVCTSIPNAGAKNVRCGSIARRANRSSKSSSTRSPAAGAPCTTGAGPAPTSRCALRRPSRAARAKRSR